MLLSLYRTFIFCPSTVFCIYDSNWVLRRRYHIQNCFVFRGTSVSERIHCPFETSSSGPFSVILSKDGRPGCLFRIKQQDDARFATVWTSGGPRSCNERSTPWGILSARLCADGSCKARGNTDKQLTASILG